MQALKQNRKWSLRGGEQRAGRGVSVLHFMQVLYSNAKFFYATMYDEQGSKSRAGEINMLCFATALFLLLVKSQDTTLRWCLNTIGYSVVWSTGFVKAVVPDSYSRAGPVFWGYERARPSVIPCQACIFFMCSISKAKICPSSEQKKAPRPAG